MKQNLYILLAVVVVIFIALVIYLAVTSKSGTEKPQAYQASTTSTTTVKTGDPVPTVDTPASIAAQYGAIAADPIGSNAAIPTVTKSNNPVVPIVSLTPGKSYVCTQNDPLGNPNVAFYRAADTNTLDLYPDPAVAASWDRNWLSASKIDCVGLKNGKKLSTNPYVLLNPGKSYKCSQNDPLGYPNQAVYRASDFNTLDHYPDPTVASSWDPDWISATKIDCTGLRSGKELEKYPYTMLVSGKSYACSANDLLNNPKVTYYRAADPYTLDSYPTAGIASVWDANWQKAPLIDCKGLKYGTALALP